MTFPTFVLILISLTSINSTLGFSIATISLWREFVGQDTEDICLSTSLGLVRNSSVLISWVEPKTWLKFCMLPIQLLNLYPVKVWQVILLKDIQDSLQCSVKEIPPDAALLELLDLFGCELGVLWQLLHISEASLNLLQFFVDNQTRDFLSRRQIFILSYRFGVIRQVF